MSIPQTDVPPPEPTTAVGRQSPTHIRYLVLIACCSLALVTYVHRLAFANAGSKMKADFSFNDEQMGWLMAAFLIAYGGFQIPCGRIGDRVGGRHLLTLLVLGWSVATALAAVVPIGVESTFMPFVSLLVLRFLFGAFQAGAFPPLTRVIADWMPVQQRGFAQGAIWMAARAGGAIIPPILLWMMIAFDGWRMPFVILGGFGILWCLAFWPWFRDRPEEMPAVNDAERELIAAGRSPHVEAKGSVPWLAMLTCPSVWGLWLLYACGGFAANFYVTLLPIYLQDHRHLSPEATSRIAGLSLGMGIVACAVGGLVSDRIIKAMGNARWGRRAVGAVGLALAGMGYVAVPHVEHAVLLGVVFAAVFFANDLSMGPAWAACADIGEKHAGTLSGSMNTAGNLAGAGGAALAGWLLHTGRSPLLFLIFGIVFGLGALSWLLVDGSKKLTRP